MELRPYKLKNGYYVLENKSGERLKRRDTLNTLIFEYKINAVNTLKRLNTYIKKNNSLPIDLIIS